MARVRASPTASSSSSEEDENGIETLARSVAIEPEQITANAPAAAAARAVRRESDGDAPAGAGKVTPIMRKARAMLDDVLSRRIRVVDADNREDGGGGRERGDGDADGGGGKASDMLIFRKAKRARGQSARGGEGNGLGLNDPRGFWQFPASTGAHLPQQKRDCNNTTTKSKKRGQKRGYGGGGSGSDSSDIERMAASIAVDASYIERQAVKYMQDAAAHVAVVVDTEGNPTGTETISAGVGPSSAKKCTGVRAGPEENQKKEPRHTTAREQSDTDAVIDDIFALNEKEDKKKKKKEKKKRKKEKNYVDNHTDERGELIAETEKHKKKKRICAV